MPPVGTIYRLSIERHFHLSALTQVNVLWFKQVAGTSLGAHDLAEDFRTTPALDTALRLFHSVRWEFDRITVQQMGPTVDDPQVSAYPSTPVTGSNFAGVFPPVLAVCLTLRTGTQGRSHRGRLYLSPCSSRWVEPNTWDATIISEINAWAAALHVRYVPAGPTPWEWGVYSPKLGGSRPATTAGFQSLSAPPSVSSNIIREVRRREK